MTDPKKWWLISDEDVQVIRKSLMTKTHREKALHALDSGLHTTDAIPDDYQRSTPKVIREMEE